MDEHQSGEELATCSAVIIILASAEGVQGRTARRDELVKEGKALLQRAVEKMGKKEAFKRFKEEGDARQFDDDPKKVDEYLRGLKAEASKCRSSGDGFESFE